MLFGPHQYALSPGPVYTVEMLGDPMVLCVGQPVIQSRTSQQEDLGKVKAQLYLQKGL